MKTRGFEIVSMYQTTGIHLPERKTGASTGYDFAAAEMVEIASGECALVPTGVKAYMQPDEVLLIYIRSSTTLRKRLMLMNSVAMRRTKGISTSRSTTMGKVRCKSRRGSGSRRGFSHAISRWMEIRQGAGTRAQAGSARRVHDALTGEQNSSIMT